MRYPYLRTKAHRRVTEDVIEGVSALQAVIGEARQTELSCARNDQVSTKDLDTLRDLLSAVDRKARSIRQQLNQVEADDEKDVYQKTMFKVLP